MVSKKMLIILTFVKLESKKLVYESFKIHNLEALHQATISELTILGINEPGPPNLL